MTCRRMFRQHTTSLCRIAASSALVIRAASLPKASVEQDPPTFTGHDQVGAGVTGLHKPQPGGRPAGRVVVTAPRRAPGGRHSSRVAVEQRAEFFDDCLQGCYVLLGPGDEYRSLQRADHHCGQWARLMCRDPELRQRPGH